MTLLATICEKLTVINTLLTLDLDVTLTLCFQGYPSELLPVTVAGIPSMHICLDFIPELLQQPHLDKQVFCQIFHFCFAL